MGKRITDVPGTSVFFVGGVIAYRNEIKKLALGVSSVTLRRFGAVSKPVAHAMAESVRNRLGSQIGVGITGVAGPGGGTKAKPVGTVWIAVSTRRGVACRCFQLAGDRERIRFIATQKALWMLFELLGKRGF
jgi:PncC family amidohydrolase